MNVKNYRGKTAEECMRKLKSEFGGDAVILQSRTVRPLFGRFGRPMHEIVAAGDAGAVLDELAERAIQRSDEPAAVEQPPARGVGARSQRENLADARSQASRTTGLGGAALALGAPPPATGRRERLTLAEAAELHEQGSYDRLVAAGILHDDAVRASSTANASTGRENKPVVGDLHLVYAKAAAREMPTEPRQTAAAEPRATDGTSPDDGRIARLEQQIALLAGVLAKQSVRSGDGGEKENALADGQAGAMKPGGGDESTIALRGSPIGIQRLSTASAEAPVKAVGASVEARSVTTAKNGQASGALGGFLRYRLPAQQAERPAQPPAEIAASMTRGGSVGETTTDSSAEPLPVNAALPFLNALRSAQMAESLLRRLSSELPDDAPAGEMREIIHDLLAQRMLIGGGIVPAAGKMTLAALLGPTGVGKTTTVAKLAASLKLSGECRVAMVTLDTSRVAAAEQLKGYGDALGITVHVAYDKAELEATLMQLAQAKTQVALIDTPGRGPLETLMIAEMSQALRSVVDLHSYVVVPAPLSASNFENTIQRFIRIAKPDALILTKMDETADNHCLGFLMNAQAKYQLPLAYVTMGGRVPDDLLAADAHLLVNKLMGAAA